MSEIKSEVFDFTKKMLGVFLPPVAVADIMQEKHETYRNIRFKNKILRFFDSQEKDFEKSIKFSENFTNESKDFVRNVTLLIDTIDMTRDDMLLDVYANLFRAFCADLLNKDAFFRLTTILDKIYYTDLLFLKDKLSELAGRGISSNEWVSIVPLLNLTNTGLCHERMSATVPTFGMQAPPLIIYQITPLGFEMIRNGVDYENRSIYKKYDGSEKGE